jgi:ABC-type transporter Mla maintaining outer membrane lipid asymmetry ATPase subunit MlaF
MQGNLSVSGAALPAADVMAAAKTARLTPLPPMGQEPVRGVELVRLVDVSKIFDTKEGPLTLLKDAHFSIVSGAFFILFGPSGCGKTTLLRLRGGFELPTIGVIALDGEDLSKVAAQQRPISRVFQSDALFNASDQVTVWSHFGLRWFKKIFRDDAIQIATWNRLIVAAAATVVSPALQSLRLSEFFPSDRWGEFGMIEMDASTRAIALLAWARAQIGGPEPGRR